MSVEKPIRSLVEEIRPGRTDRAILVDVARVVDGHTKTLADVSNEVIEHRSEFREFRDEFDELKGHLMRADAQGRQASSHDLEQDMRIAKLDERVEVVETGWRAVGSRIQAFFDHPKTKWFAQFVFTLAMGYAAARGIKVLP